MPGPQSLPPDVCLVVNVSDHNVKTYALWHKGVLSNESQDIHVALLAYFTTIANKNPRPLAKLETLLIPLWVDGGFVSLALHPIDDT